MDHKTQLRIHDHLTERHQLQVGVFGGYLKRNLSEPVISPYFEGTDLESVTFSQEGVRHGSVLYPWGVEAVVKEDGMGFIMMPEENLVGIFGEPTEECLQALAESIPDFDLGLWDTEDDWLKGACERECQYGQFGQLVGAGMANRLCLREFECGPSQGQFEIPAIMLLARDYKRSLTPSQIAAGKRLFCLELDMLEDVLYMGTEACSDPHTPAAWLSILMERDRLESAYTTLDCPADLKERLEEFDAGLKRWLPRDLDLTHCAQIRDLEEIRDRDTIDAWWGLYAEENREAYLKDIEDMLNGVE